MDDWQSLVCLDRPLGDALWSPPPPLAFTCSPLVQASLRPGLFGWGWRGFNIFNNFFFSLQSHAAMKVSPGHGQNRSCFFVFFNWFTSSPLSAFFFFFLPASPFYGTDTNNASPTPLGRLWGFSLVKKMPFIGASGSFFLGWSHAACRSARDCRLISGEGLQRAAEPPTCLPPTPDVTHRPADRFLINSEESASLFHHVTQRCTLVTSDEEELLCFGVFFFLLIFPCLFVYDFFF